MTVSILDLHCLNAVSDDYETVASIMGDVRRSADHRQGAAGARRQLGRRLIAA